MNKFLRPLILLSGFFLAVSCGIMNHGQDSRISYSQYLGGRWGPWSQSDMDWIDGSPDNYVIYSKTGHPSNYGVKIITVGLYLDSMEQEKWYSLTGFIEFYSGYSDAKEASHALVKSANLYGIGSQVTRFSHSRPAHIDVIKTRKGVLYNVFFDDVGLAILLPML